MDLIAARLPVEAYFGGDDVSDQRSIMMGLKRWRYFFKPRLEKLIMHAHELGLPFVLHACGNVLPLIDDLIEISLDGLESLQSEATDVFAVKQKAHGRLVLIGGMGVQSTLFRGTPQEVQSDARRLLEKLGGGGGYIFAPSKPLENEPVENVAALIEVLTRQE
jgi:uroporphyrinogen decarboxylase